MLWTVVPGDRYGVQALPWSPLKSSVGTARASYISSFTAPALELPLLKVSWLTLTWFHGCRTTSFSSPLCFHQAHA